MYERQQRALEKIAYMYYEYYKRNGIPSTDDNNWTKAVELLESGDKEYIENEFAVLERSS